MVIWEHVAQLQQQMTFSTLPVDTACGLRAKKGLCQQAPRESAVGHLPFLKAELSIS